MAWKSLYCPAAELNLRVLGVGQSFRWKRIDDLVWQGIFNSRVWQLYHKNDQLCYRVLAEFPTAQIVEHSEVLKDYFQLNVNLTDLHKQWTKNKDSYFVGVLTQQPGIRILRQDPVECLLSFICSSNNNIKRISSMIENLCRNFGDSVTVEEPISNAEITFYNFPPLEKLTDPKVEVILRNLNFGYRARYIAETASKLFDIDDNPANLLLNLRNKSYEECRRLLMTLSGVGGKVADCVCLMALDKTDVVPIDTHVLQITAEHYLPELKKLKSLNEKTHKVIGRFYREKFGNFAGWAQAALFANEIKD